MSPVLTRTPAEAFLNHWVQGTPFQSPQAKEALAPLCSPVSPSTPFYCCPGI